MNINFDKCMEILLQHEGSYVNGNKISDPGGITNMGVTKRTYDEYHGVDIDEEGMKSLAVEHVAPIYKDYYWYRCRGERLPSRVDWAVFDASVNHGTGRAAKFLQKAVGANIDESVGPLTLANVGFVEPSEIINHMAIYRDAFYRSLGTFGTFGKGWIRRNNKTRETALQLITEPKQQITRPNLNVTCPWRTHRKNTKIKCIQRVITLDRESLNHYTKVK